MNKSVKEDNFGNIAFDNNADKLLKLLSMIAYNHNLVSAISYNKDNGLTARFCKKMQRRAVVLFLVENKSL